VSDATAFNPMLYVTDETMCSVGASFGGWANDEIACTYPPKLWACPGFKLSPDPDSTTYYAMVISLGTCNGTYGEYELTVETDEDPSLTLVADDENFYRYIVTATGSLHVK
jgi:hypothetical protein